MWSARSVVFLVKIFASEIDLKRELFLCMSLIGTDN